jgi:hypothetical protein
MNGQGGELKYLVRVVPLKSLDSGYFYLKNRDSMSHVYTMLGAAKTAQSFSSTYQFHQEGNAPARRYGKGKRMKLGVATAAVVLFCALSASPDAGAATTTAQGVTQSSNLLSTIYVLLKNSIGNIH